MINAASLLNLHRIQFAQTISKTKITKNNTSWAGGRKERKKEVSISKSQALKRHWLEKDGRKWLLEGSRAKSYMDLRGNTRGLALKQPPWETVSLKLKNSLGSVWMGKQGKPRSLKHGSSFLPKQHNDCHSLSICRKSGPTIPEKPNLTWEYLTI